jgi:quinol monooxygenase YgiN
MIHVLAIITTQPGQRAAVLAAFRENAVHVRAEVGCIEYNATVDAEGSPAVYGDDAFIVIEKWATPADLKAHSAAPHMTAYAARTKALVKTRVIHVLTPVA